MDIISELADTITLMELPAHARVFLLDEMATIEYALLTFYIANCLIVIDRYRLSSGGSDKIQLGALVGAFKIGVEMAAGSGKQK